MSCKEIVEVITEYLESTMGAENRERFEAHLEICPFCVTYLEQMRQTIVTIGDLQADSISSDTRQELVTAFRDWRGAASP